MAKKNIKASSMSRVTPGSTAVLDLAIGPTYESIVFTCTGTSLAASHIGKIRVLANGQEIQTYNNLQELIDLNTNYGRSADTVNQFMIHAVLTEFRDLAYQRTSGWGTKGLATLTIEFDLAAGAPANITMQANVNIDTVPQPLGTYIRVRSFPGSSPVAGVVEMDKLPRNGEVYKAIHIFKADVSNVVLTVDQNVVIDASKAILERTQKQARPVARAPLTAKATHIDFLLDGDPGDMLATQVLRNGQAELINDLRLAMTLDTSGAYSILTETVDVWNR